MTENPLHRWLEDPPYGIPQKEKEERLLESMHFLTDLHYSRCPAYKNILDRVFSGESSCQPETLENVPFLPVSLFKTLELKSIPEDQVFKELQSSGTTGQQVSRIFLDKETAQLQARVLVKVFQHFVGKQRRPMVILDHSGTVKDRTNFSARGAGILGMAQFGREPFYALREDMSLDVEGLHAYLEKWERKNLLFFGFTFMVWKHFLQAFAGGDLGLRDSLLVHSGGWKKLQEEAVSAEEFRQRVKKVTGISEVINFYGMVEQVGSIYFENPLHFLQAPAFSDVLIRDPVSLKPLPRGEVGAIQVLSMIPSSYPGHSLLTEDLGVVRGIDDPRTGMQGKYFEVLGRVPQAKVRGCSDTFTTSASEAP